jgi:putative transposase
VRCPKCRSAVVKKRPERTAQSYRRFRCRDCTKQFNERSSGLLNRAQYPGDVIALVVLSRLRYKLSLRDLAEMFLIRGFVFTYETLCGWTAAGAVKLSCCHQFEEMIGCDAPTNALPVPDPPSVHVRGA